MQTPQIDFHPSVGERTLEREAIASLRENRIDPKLLYVTPRQADLWREVFLRHSPIHGNAEFARIYREAFAAIAQRVAAEKIWLIGLGCGTGMKEAELGAQLVANGKQVCFSAVDVSRDLVDESARKVGTNGVDLARNLVCDLSETEFLDNWLAQGDGTTPRLFTFFGLVPNLAPSLVAKLFRAVLRSGDLLLVSAHLAPVGDGLDLAAAMRKVLPQYDNAETLAWLSVALEEWEIKNVLDAPAMKIGEMECVPAFVAEARWKSENAFEKWGERFSPKTAEPLRLFHSIRYTPESFEEFLRKEGFTAERLAMTACREEGIWLVSR